MKTKPSNGFKNHNRHDYSNWGNSNFAQNNSSREYDRINSNFDNTEHELNDSIRSGPTRYDFDQNSPYNHPTWGRTNNEGYIWENGGRQEHHSGKGPKGYKRRDERILEDIHDRLTYDNFLDASHIAVTVTNGEVTLTGTVSERMDKRRAEDIAESVSGVQHLENRIRVNHDEIPAVVSNGKTSAESRKHYKTLMKTH